MRKFGFVAVAMIAAAAPAMAASERFAFEYWVERADAARLPIESCLATAKTVSNSLGYATMLEKVFPGQLATLASGPRGGGSSLIVHCIAVDNKTAFVVQALDYMHPVSPAAKRAADAVHRALLVKAGR